MAVRDFENSRAGKARAYIQRPAPLLFPVEEMVPESARHLLLRTALFLSLRAELGSRAIITSDQFVYWDPTDPTQCLAPDLAVRLSGPSTLLDSWKTWELGAPEVAVEIVSEHDRSQAQTALKLERYRRAGIGELVRFDPDELANPLRLFDRFDGDLAERSLSDPEAFRCDVLGLYWVVLRDAALGPTLRLARDRYGRELLQTAEEARDAALTRIRELESELRRRG